MDQIRSLKGKLIEAKRQLRLREEICEKYVKGMDEYAKKIQGLEKELTKTNKKDHFVYKSNHSAIEDLDHFCAYSKINAESKKELFSIIEGLTHGKQNNDSEVDITESLEVGSLIINPIDDEGEFAIEIGSRSGYTDIDTEEAQQVIDFLTKSIREREQLKRNEN